MCGLPLAAASVTLQCNTKELAAASSFESATIKAAIKRQPNNGSITTPAMQYYKLQTFYYSSHPPTHTQDKESGGTSTSYGRMEFGSFLHCRHSFMVMMAFFLFESKTILNFTNDDDHGLLSTPPPIHSHFNFTIPTPLKFCVKSVKCSFYCFGTTTSLAFCQPKGQKVQPIIWHFNIFFWISVNIVFVFVVCDKNAK